jgi:LAS superfamily LD-carboxypeptidase LdcB
MDLICKKCKITFYLETDRELICENCKIQLDLLDQQLKVNQERINKLKDHKKSELKNPKSKNPETHLETMKRLEYNLQLEYKKRDGIIKTMNSKNTF